MSLEYDFQDAMSIGKAIAADRRARGLSSGKNATGWNVKRQQLTGIDAIEAYYNQFRKDIQYQAYTAVEMALFGDDLFDLCEF